MLHPPHRTLCRTTALALLAALPGCRQQGSRPSHERSEPAPKESSVDKRLGVLQIRNVRVVAGGIQRPQGRLFRGEQVQIRVTVTGLSSNARRVRLAASLQLRDASKQVVATSTPAAVSRRVPSGHATDLLLLAVDLKVPPLALPGRGTLRVEARDLLTHRRATRSIQVTVVGPVAPQPRRLKILQWHLPPPEDLLAGLPLVLDLEAAGIQAAKAPPHKILVTGRAALENRKGQALGRSEATLLKLTPSFHVYQARLRWLIPLPPSLTPGRYGLHVTLRDEADGAQVDKRFPVSLLPGGLGIYAVTLSGADGSPRDTFGRGDTLLAQLSLAGWTPPASLDIGVGLVGPDHGIYFVRKRARRLVLQAGDRRPRILRVPIRVPEFVPTGRWSLQLRVLDIHRRAQATRSVRFRVEGVPLRPLPRFTARHLTISHPGDPLPIPGIFLKAGSSLSLSLEVGGMRLKHEAGYYYHVHLRCAVRLRSRTGALVKRKERACVLDRRFPFQPMRLRLHARFQIPRGALGLHQLEVEVLDLESDRVSMVVRRIFLLAAARGQASP